MAEEITAPLAGRILSTSIEVGQSVKEDDEAFVIEAMKMESTIFVPCDGVVKEIRVKPGDEIDEDDILGSIE